MSMSNGREKHHYKSTLSVLDMRIGMCYCCAFYLLKPNPHNLPFWRQMGMRMTPVKLKTYPAQTLKRPTRYVWCSWKARAIACGSAAEGQARDALVTGEGGLENVWGLEYLQIRITSKRRKWRENFWFYMRNRVWLWPCKVSSITQRRGCFYLEPQFFRCFLAPHCSQLFSRVSHRLVCRFVDQTSPNLHHHTGHTTLNFALLSFWRLSLFCAA